ncbi:MAG TPA: DUF333 domain-containing protein [Chondromyces sp.]|nr:DUF333 domain-containing protein [Chondromyces sp.]
MLLSTGPAAAQEPAKETASLANPAAVHCQELGGTRSIETRGDGSEFGVCSFEDDRQCEEWALLRGACPDGGLKVTGYATEAARYCAITGGTYEEADVADADTEGGGCILADGRTCDVWEYFNGTCGDTTEPSREDQPESFTNPFIYCAAFGTIDKPDDRFVGADPPEAVVDGLVEQGVVAADAPAWFKRNAVWRCVDGEVEACHFGANLPCLEKADTSRTPNAAMEEYCTDNPGADSIPAAVTGRATVFGWGCEGGTPVVVEQVFQVDSAGFLADFWHRLPAPVERSGLISWELGRARFSHDGRVATIPVDPDNIDAIREVIQSGSLRSENVEIDLYKPAGLLPQLLIVGQPDQVKGFVSTVTEVFLGTGIKHMVVISARLTQLSDSDIRSLGVNLFPSSLTYDGQYSFESGEPGYGFLDIFLNQSASGNVLVADESLSKGKALVASQVFTPNGVKAVISDVQHEPVFSIDTYGNVQTEYQDLETTIEVVPMVVSFEPESVTSSKVRLDISVKVSTISGEKRTGDVTAPQYSDKSFETTRVFPADGHTYLVGSFVSDSDITSRSGVPGLSKIPILKYLFSQKTTTRSRSYALLTLAVNILPASYSWDQVRQEGWSTVPSPAASNPQKKTRKTRKDEDELSRMLDQVTRPSEAHDGANRP